MLFYAWNSLSDIASAEIQKSGMNWPAALICTSVLSDQLFVFRKISPLSCCDFHDNLISELYSVHQPWCCFRWRCTGWSNPPVLIQDTCKGCPYWPNWHGQWAPINPTRQVPVFSWGIQLAVLSVGRLSIVGGLKLIVHGPFISQNQQTRFSMLSGTAMIVQVSCQMFEVHIQLRLMGPFHWLSASW